LENKEIINGTVEFLYNCKTGLPRKSNKRCLIKKKILTSNEKPTISVEFGKIKLNKKR
jgi:hypothetical protein